MNYHDAFASALLDPSGASGPELASLARQPAFAVYRNTFMKAAIDALQANFPAVTTLVGESWFRAAAAEFVRATPPAQPTLLHYGEGFAAFLQDFPPAAELPWLVDVARLDRLWTEAHAAADAPCLDAAGLLAITTQCGGDLGDLVLTLHPATRCAWAPEHPAYEIWSATRTGRKPDTVHWRGQGTLLTRPDGVVLWDALDEAGWLLLDESRTGRELGAVAAEVLTAWPGTDFMALLARLIAAGAFAQPDGLPATDDPEEDA